jgi:hypothetical protein
VSKEYQKEIAQLKSCLGTSQELFDQPPTSKFFYLGGGRRFLSPLAILLSLYVL